IGAGRRVHRGSDGELGDDRERPGRVHRPHLGDPGHGGQARDGRAVQGRTCGGVATAVAAAAAVAVAVAVAVVTAITIVAAVTAAAALAARGGLAEDRGRVAAD